MIIIKFNITKVLPFCLNLFDLLVVTFTLLIFFPYIFNQEKKYLAFCFSFVPIMWFFVFFLFCRNGAHFEWPCRNNEKQSRNWVSLSSWHRSRPPLPWTRCPAGEGWWEVPRLVATCQWPQLSPTPQLHPPHPHYHCPSSNIGNNTQSSSSSSSNNSRSTAKSLPLSMQATWTLRATQQRVVVQSRPALIHPYLRFPWLRTGRIQARRSWTTSCKWLCLLLPTQQY